MIIYFKGYSMEYRTHIEEGSNIRFMLSGRMIYTDYKSVKDIIYYVMHNNTKSLILDMSSLEFIDSAAVGMLIIILEELRKVDASMRIVNSHGQLLRVLANSKFFFFDLL